MSRAKRLRKIKSGNKRVRHIKWVMAAIHHRNMAMLCCEYELRLQAALIRNRRGETVMIPENGPELVKPPRRLEAIIKNLTPTQPK